MEEIVFEELSNMEWKINYNYVKKEKRDGNKNIIITFGAMER